MYILNHCANGAQVFLLIEKGKPSGRPAEKTKTIIMDDPTWKNELNYFKDLINSNSATSLQKDIWLFNTINELGNT